MTAKRFPHIGLVLEGGAMRGMFTAGILDVLMENEIEFGGMVGVSAGATFGCNFKSKQIGRSIRYNKRFCKDWRYGTVQSLLRTGDLYEAKFCYEDIPNELDPFDTQTFAENPMEFYIAVTDMETGEPLYHTCSDGKENDILWMRASASLPMVSRPVQVEGRLLSDGGTADSIPLPFMEGKGYAKNIVVLTQPRGYEKKPSSIMKVMGIALNKYPKLLEALEHRHEMYNRQTEYVAHQEAQGAAFVLAPPEPLGISRTEHDPAELERVYQIGRTIAEEQLPKLLAFCAE